MKNALLIVSLVLLLVSLVQVVVSQSAEEVVTRQQVTIAKLSAVIEDYEGLAKRWQKINDTNEETIREYRRMAGGVVTITSGNAANGNTAPGAVEIRGGKRTEGPHGAVTIQGNPGEDITITGGNLKAGPGGLTIKGSDSP